MNLTVEILVMRLALAGLAASVAALALKSRLVRAASARLLDGWRGMTPWGRFVLCAFVLITADASVKTNNTMRLANLPRILRKAAPPARNGRSMADFAAWRTGKWNTRGA